MSCQEVINKIEPSKDQATRERLKRTLHAGMATKCSLCHHRYPKWKLSFLHALVVPQHFLAHDDCGHFILTLSTIYFKQEYKSACIWIQIFTAMHQTFVCNAQVHMWFFRINKILLFPLFFYDYFTMVQGDIVKARDNSGLMLYVMI